MTKEFLKLASMGNRARLLIAIFLVIAVMVNFDLISIGPAKADFNTKAATPGYFPQGTIKASGVSSQEVLVEPGKSIPFTISLNQSEKVCNVYLMVLNANQSSLVGTRRSFKGPRGSTNQPTMTITDSIDTTGLKPGKYRAFIYANTNCGGDVFGNDNDGFDCDANPTCWSYCTQPSRDKLDTSQMPYEPGDLYRTNSNPAYYESSKVKQLSQNTCGEPKGANPGDNDKLIPGREGECELKACDPTGKNLDVLSFNIPDSSGNVPGPHGNYNVSGLPKIGNPTVGTSTGGTGGGAGGGTPGGTTATNVTALKVADGQVSVPGATSALTDKSVLDVSAGVAVANDKNQVKIGSGMVDLTKYTGGAIEKGVDVTVQNVGGVDVKVAKVVQLQSSGGVSLGNSDFPSVTANIPDKTSVLAPAGWNGQVQPPVKVTTNGTPPSGFKIGDLTINIGSTTQPLLLDKPVTIVFSGVKTGDMTFKEPGGADFKIMTKCTGDFASPTPPDFPGQCFVQNGSDTKVVTWHFSNFAIVLPQVPVFESIDPGVCLSSKKQDDFLVDLTMLPNPNFQAYVIARTECSDLVTCNGSEKIINPTAGGNSVQFIPIKNPIFDYNDIAGLTAGKYYKYRVWGLLKDQPTPASVTPASLDPKWWSLPQVVKVGCFQGGGLNIKELVIPPSPTP